MENKDLANKKINNEQKVNEGFSGENIPADYNPAKGKLKSETETDENGNTKKVERARNPDSNTESHTSATANNTRGVNSEKDIEKTVENKDKNSDITPNRYPNSHADNHENRGNMELDKE